MTVRNYIEDYFNNNRTKKSIRIIDAVTRHGINQHWLNYANLIVIKAKVTEKYLFIYI